MIICSYQLNIWLGPQTNNHLEGWHSAFNNTVNRAHPNFFKFIDHVKKEQKKFELKLLQIETGGKVVQPKKKFADMERKIQAAITFYANSEDPDYYREFIDEVCIYLHV